MTHLLMLMLELQTCFLNRDSVVELISDLMIVLNLVVFVGILVSFFPFGILIVHSHPVFHSFLCLVVLFGRLLSLNLFEFG